MVTPSGAFKTNTQIINIMVLSKYTNGTKKYLKAVAEYLTNKYGELPAQWEQLIYLLGDNIDLYNQCKESVEQNGIFDPTTGKKNPLLSTMKDLQATIIKQVQHFGLSPYAVSKIKIGEEDSTDDLIEALTNE